MPEHDSRHNGNWQGPIVVALRIAVPCIDVSLGRRLVNDSSVEPLPNHTLPTTLNVCFISLTIRLYLLGRNLQNYRAE